jgi:outer membrane protein assembly factor BamB
MRRPFAAVLAALVCMGVARAQFGRGAGDWMTTGTDAQRSSWIRSDAKISRDSLQKPGFEFLWKLKLDANAKQSFAAPMLLNSYIGYRGFRSLAYIGATSNKVVAIDTDLGRIEWQEHLPGGAASPGCAGATPSLARPTTVAFPATGGGRGGGGGGGGRGATSTVSEPNQGSVIYQQAAAAQARVAANPPAASGGRGRAGAPPAPGGRPPRTVGLLYVLTTDGRLQGVLQSNGKAFGPAVQFLPPNSSALGLIVIDDMAYAAVAQGCGSAANAVMAVDLTSQEVTTWKPGSGQITGSAGPAIGSDGTLYVATTGGELAALEPKTLKLKTAYKAGQPFTSSPVIFEFKDKVLLAATTQDGSVHLLDSKDLSRIAGAPSASLSSGSLASWQDLAGSRWILATGAKAVGAVKVVEQNGAITLQPSWNSNDISPVTPVIVNGVAFTASTGSSPGVLYALDAASGRELWNSGKSIAGAIRGGGISVGNSQVYLATAEGTFYAFGFPIEH